MYRKTDNEAVSKSVFISAWNHYMPPEFPSVWRWPSRSLTRLVWIDLSWQQNVKVTSCRTFLPWADMTLWTRPSCHPHTVYLRENKCLRRSSNDFFPRLQRCLQRAKEMNLRWNTYRAWHSKPAMECLNQSCVACGVSTTCRSILSIYSLFLPLLLS